MSTAIHLPFPSTPFPTPTSPNFPSTQPAHTESGSWPTIDPEVLKMINAPAQVIPSEQLNSFVHDIEEDPSILLALAQGVAQAVAAYYSSLPNVSPGIRCNLHRAVLLTRLIRDKKAFFSQEVQTLIETLFFQTGNVPFHLSSPS